MTGTVRTVRPERRRLRTDLADQPDRDAGLFVVLAFVLAWLARNRR
jgi:hypothetical protein